MTCKVCISPVAINPDGVLCQSRDHKLWYGCRSTLGVTRGQYYYEAEVTDEGLCRVGWATSAATLELGQLGMNTKLILGVSVVC